METRPYHSLAAPLGHCRIIGLTRYEKRESLMSGICDGNLSNEDIARLVEGLRKAGLEVPAEAP